MRPNESSVDDQLPFGHVECSAARTGLEGLMRGDTSEAIRSRSWRQLLVDVRKRVATSMRLARRMNGEG